mgnify:CR=1 FL=1
MALFEHGDISIEVDDLARFAIVDVMGDYSGGAWDPGRSARMLVRMRR